MKKTCLFTEGTYAFSREQGVFTQVSWVALFEQVLFMIFA